MKYYIWSHRHDQWWGPDKAGYTSHLRRAGQYDKEEAAEITLNCLPGANVAVSVALADTQLDYPMEEVKRQLEIVRRL